ncbi:GerW family sporulation protein [Paenibacillus macerans]|uniref:GerW family sporulation protein n=1 Tax=Paenibacillus macerans TaxID=44252 RepID=UPI0020421D8E|nr:GerW family sporulation protein [Paenibacillus macerans]MCM3698216.1 GerW family sporulation protein [Paenibacillus macerans]
MADHPIQGLMQTAMENIKEMVDVNTIVGEPVQTADGGVILPISRVGFGFAAGGSDFNVDEKNGASSHEGGNLHPFGGGSGGGVSINPIAFLVVGKSGVHIVPLDNQTHLVERIIDAVPGVIDKIQSMFPGINTANGGMMTAQTVQASQTAQAGLNAANVNPAVNPFA